MYLENVTLTSTYQKAKYQKNSEVHPLLHEKCKYLENPENKIKLQGAWYQKNSEIRINYQNMRYQKNSEIQTVYQKRRDQGTPEPSKKIQKNQVSEISNKQK